MEADVKKANMPLKFISLLERWWELNRSGADKESGDIKAIVSFQREKEDRIYLFPARPLCREHLIFPLHLFFFPSSTAAAPRHRQQREPSGPETQNQLQTDRQHRKGSYQQQFVSLFIYFIAYKKEKIYKRSV